MTVKLAVIYYSATSTTYQLARAVAQGAQQAGAEVRFRKVQELAPDQAI
jgi:NAD(P)H dehydrogenase (quinone)